MFSTLQALVLNAASVHADRTAVVYDSRSMSDSPVSLLYKDLLQLAVGLSLVLQEYCTDNNGVIGLYCCDDLFVPVWILGILQSPAAYVPLDPEAPGLLCARVIHQCGLKYCVVKTELLQAAVEEHISVDICVEVAKFKMTLILVKLIKATENKSKPQQTVDGAVTGRQPGDRGLAYVLHTSGTTGPSKIVRVLHKCILPNILHLRSLFQMSADDVVFLASPLTFDPSVVDIFLALSSGAQLLIIPSMVKKMPHRLATALFKDNKTTVLQVTPTLLCSFSNHIIKQDVLSSGSSLRVLVLGGEAFPSPALLRSCRDEDNKTHVFNIYGITEVSCWASCYEIPQTLLQSTFRVPLGTPLRDTVLEVRDEHGGIITEGEGQVFIGGEDRVCLLGDEDTVINGMMRATGDWVKVQDSQLYYLGRRDRLIKRNGKRVNLDNVQQVRRRHQENTSSVEADLSRQIMKQVSLLLPSYSVPDAVVLLPALCLTAHGEFTTSLSVFDHNILGLDEDAALAEESNFLLSGGDSLKALHLCEDISTTVGVATPKLLEVILDGTFVDILHYIDSTMLMPLLENDSNSLREAQKRRSGSPSDVPAKKERGQSPCEDLLQQETQAFKVIRRGAEVIEMDPKKERSNLQAAADVDKYSCRKEENVLELCLSWSSDTGRCVDASPIILVRERTEQSSVVAERTVFIGSHSHRFQALDLDTGRLLWERVLGDRVESSAAVSHCGTLVVVGCYDGCVYFLSTNSGKTQWTFETGDAVKSCPAVDPHTGLVIVGSHDGHVYALNPKCVWKHHCGGRAVFSSPHLQPDLRQLFVASLGGELLCLHPDSGDILWSNNRNVPFFSSPNCGSGLVVLGSVDGNICCYSSTGKLVRRRIRLAV
uniref:Aminoadipate-semialdehyde dehydrogenase n=1 Tax=Cynoglossus semilaevis TaxID=244447 RepID=A0A3P8UTR0_CYNSE